MGAMTLVGNVTGAAIGLFFPVSYYQIYCKRNYINKLKTNTALCKN